MKLTFIVYILYNHPGKRYSQLLKSSSDLCPTLGPQHGPDRQHVEVARHSDMLETQCDVFAKKQQQF
jgi:hypothetical protein